MSTSATRSTTAPASSSLALRTSSVVPALGAWLAAALLIGALGWLGRLRPPGPQLVLLAITLVLLAVGRAWAPLREWLASVDLRTLLVPHLGRFLAGSAFLVLVARGALPREFVQAGIGDVAVAVLAAALIAFVPPDRPGARRWYLAWNVLGLADILLVLATGVRLGMREPDVVSGFGRLPLALLPLFLVPLVLATHAWIFGRLRRSAWGLRAGGAIE